jgi:hypothetical protein
MKTRVLYIQNNNTKNSIATPGLVAEGEQPVIF